MRKVLSGEQYTQSRLAGIMHETFVERNGVIPTLGNRTMYGEGMITNNNITGELGLLLDTESEYYASVPEIHASRLIDVVNGDGWYDVAEEEPVGGES